MNKSESIAKLADALAKAQGEMKAAFKNRQNPFFKSSFADLESVWDACRNPLFKHGLSVSQPTDIDENGKIILTTILLHSSGEWISSKLPINPIKNDPQGIGSAISYMKRFGLSAIVGVATSDVEKTDESHEDDDGESAVGRGPGDSFNKETQSSTIILPPEKWKMGAQEWNTLEALLEKSGLAPERALAWCRKKWPGIEAINSLDERQFDQLVIKLKEEIDKLNVK